MKSKEEIRFWLPLMVYLALVIISVLWATTVLDSQIQGCGGLAKCMGNFVKEFNQAKK